MNKEEHRVEMENLSKFIENQHKEYKKHLELNKDKIKKFKRYCKSLSIELHDDDFEYWPTIGIVAKKTDILARLEPKINIDKEGLVSCDLLERLFVKKESNFGYYYSDNYMAMASPLFRRGMGEINNWSPNFIKEFWELSGDQLDLYLLLDFNRVRIDVNDRQYLEADTWYGPPFNESVSSIKDGAVKLRPPLDIKPEFIKFFFNSTYSLDVSWTTNNGIKVFQAWEFKDEERKIEKYKSLFYPVRYLHAEYDEKAGTFRHFDGAIQYYTEQEYFKRRDSDSNHNLKTKDMIKAQSEKLFKINGEISVPLWVNFCSQFYTGNPLIIEYFTGELPERLESKIRKLRESGKSN